MSVLRLTSVLEMNILIEVRSFKNTSAGNNNAQQNATRGRHCERVWGA